jgi:hypothetical protein
MKESQTIAAINCAQRFLVERFEGAAEPLWELDDDGYPIETDVGCVEWVSCELFEIIQSPQPQPQLEETEDSGITVTLQAQMMWSHWDCVIVREFYVDLSCEDGNWIVLDWESADIDYEIDYEEGTS